MARWRPHRNSLAIRSAPKTRKFNNCICVMLPTCIDSCMPAYSLLINCMLLLLLSY